MRKLILAVSFIIGLSVMAQAQITQKSPEQRAGHITKILQKRLNLSPDQASQINTVLLNRATRMDSLKNNLSADKKGNHLAARSIMLSTQRQVLAVLDDSQKQKFMEWEKMRKEKHREKQGDVSLKS
jgi:protein CpxP